MIINLPREVHETPFKFIFFFLHDRCLALSPESRILWGRKLTLLSRICGLNSKVVSLCVPTNALHEQRPRTAGTFKRNDKDKVSFDFKPKQTPPVHF